MTDVFNTIEVNPVDHAKLVAHLEAIKQAQVDSPELYTAIEAATKEFNQFFLNFGKPYFAGKHLELNETAESAVYNENMTTLAQDLDRLYASLLASAQTTLSAYNYSTIVANEVNNAAQVAASKVLDLNILNNFTKGAVIVAGDDFINTDKIDTSYGVETTQAEVLDGASSVSLLRVSSEVVSTPDTVITVTPLMPQNIDGSVTTAPTPNNLERFYEGMYYAPIGQMRPAGGVLDLQYIVDPSLIPGLAVETQVNGVVDPNQSTKLTPDDVYGNLGGLGYYAIIEPPETSKQVIRQRMLDGDPSTFWECEVVFASEPLIDPLEDGSISLETSAVDAQDNG